MLGWSGSFTNKANSDLGPEQSSQMGHEELIRKGSFCVVEEARAQQEEGRGGLASSPGQVRQCLHDRR